MTRYSINKLAEETKLDRRTIKKVLTDAQIQPDSSDRYTFADLVAAIRGQGARSEMEREKLAKITAERELLQMQIRKESGELIEVAEVERGISKWVISLKQLVMNSKQFKESERNEFLHTMSSILGPQVEPRKSKRGKNG